MNQLGIEKEWDESQVIKSLLSEVTLPKMAKIKQIFESQQIEDIETHVRQELHQAKIANTIRPKMTVAIAVGSRGISNITLITKQVVEAVKAMGAVPYIVPAMGSHGGATAEGQIAILETLGITESSVGAPIKATMKVVEIGRTDDNHPIYMDLEASKADGIILIGRVKPHTSFRGRYESGLYKMMVIGLGNQVGAASCHGNGFEHMANTIEQHGRVILSTSKLLFGIAIVENAYDETHIIEALLPHEITTKEPQLLEKAKNLMPRLMFDHLDVLIVDAIGKNYSGDGMDPNITGTPCSACKSLGPSVQKYVVLDLSDETKGNAIGIGMADFTTLRAAQKIDTNQMYLNALTCRAPHVVKIPMILESDKEAIAAALYSCNQATQQNPRIIRIMKTTPRELKRTAHRNQSPFKEFR
jgi:hypothetical protein